MINKHDVATVQHLWVAAMREDGADYDVTSIISVSEMSTGVVAITARQAGVFAGEMILNIVAEEHDVAIDRLVHDGERFEPGQTLAMLSGSQRLLLGIERSLLNFLQRLCGVATITRQYVDAVAGTEAKILDTRKTIPGWRLLDKYAVRCGGGCNHRMGLNDAVLIKDNHIAAIELPKLADEMTRMVKASVQLDPQPNFFECEVDTLDQFKELIKVDGLDVILLDNFTLDDMRQAVALRDEADLKGSLELEASGCVQLDTVTAIAQTGVDRISIGAITHSVAALDLGMDAA